MDKYTHGSAVELTFLLYRGSSSLHLESFQLGEPVTAWPHKKAALTLLRDSWEMLARHGRDIDLWVQQVLDQESGNSNWRHGKLYATPSKLSAVRYADCGSAYGGELLTLCHEAVTLLGEIDKQVARQFCERDPTVAHFLKGGGEPILVEITALRARDLSAEREKDNVSEMIRFLTDSHLSLDLIGQQMNFAIEHGCGLIRRLHTVQVESPGDHLTHFELNEIC